MSLKIEKVAVLGGGVMGSGIAAHIAGCGIPVTLLDIVPRELTREEARQGLTLDHPGVRNRFALKGVQTALEARPAAFFDKKDAKLIRCGNYEDDIAWLGEVDWIIEVVVENLAIKKKVFEMVAGSRKPGSLVTSNTSGLFVRDMAAGMPGEMRRHFFVTHFFNPVRYMKLLEVVAGEDTDRGMLSEFAAWSDRVLGKGIVYGKDTPNFVANRIGVHGILGLMHVMEEMGLTVEQVDKIMGPATGRPKSAAFRTLDMVGLDTFIHVADNVYEGAPDDEEREIFKPHPIFYKLEERGWLGDKTGRTGFYRVVKKDGKREILSLDLKTMEHGPQQKVRYPSLGKARDVDDVAERLRIVVGAEDEAGRFAWKVLSRGLVYACRRIPEIADDIVNIDNAMKWGFAWDLGPFETWDALGVGEVVRRLEAEGREVPELAREVIERGEGSFYVRRDGDLHYWCTLEKRYRPVAFPEGTLFLAPLKERKRVVRKLSSASLVDLDDGVLCMEFHSKMNVLDTDMMQIFELVREMRARGEVAGVVVGNEGKQAFCAGANLFLIFTTVAQKQWDELEKLVRTLQDTNMAMLHGDFPVVVAPHDLTLGGGMEVTLHATAVQAAAETYMGLVEAGVGLIPAGGGCKELLFRKRALTERKGPRGPFPFVQQTFEAIATVQVATSAKQARSWGYIGPGDGITLNKDYLIADAKRRVLELAGAHEPFAMRTISLPGESGRLALEYGVEQMARRGLVTQYETHMAATLARVLTGGDTHPTEELTEQDLLDLEREAFLSLAGEQKTFERIQHMLSKNKPLRN
jgi:3-hydroxyacyl-CoA dehydrogenase